MGALTKAAVEEATWKLVRLSWSDQLIDGKPYKVFMRRWVDGVPQCRVALPEEVGDENRR